MLLKFYSDHCRACPQMDTWLDDNNIDYRSVNVEIYSSLAAKYCVMCLPTLIKLDANDQILWRIEGFNRVALIKRLKE